MKSKLLIAAGLILLLAVNVSAKNFCFAEAERYYNIDRRILYAISIVESRGNNCAINVSNQNQSIDRGHMQINSWWGFTQEELADPCFQTLAGAAILSDCFKKYGNGPDAISCYNTGKSINELPLKKKQLAKKYVAKVYERVLR